MFAVEASTDNTTTQPVGVEQPFPTKGTVPVVTPSPAKSSESASGKIKEAPKEKTRESATPTPSASPSASREQATRKRQSATTTRERVTTISGYTYCGNSAGAAQPCIDNGSLVLYYPRGEGTTPTLAGPNRSEERRGGQEWGRPCR